MARKKPAALAMKAHMYRQGCYVLGITPIDPERNDPNSAGQDAGVPLFQQQAMRESSLARVIAALSAVGTRGQSMSPRSMPPRIYS